MSQSLAAAKALWIEVGDGVDDKSLTGKSSFAAALIQCPRYMYLYCLHICCLYKFSPQTKCSVRCNMLFDARVKKLSGLVTCI